MADRDDHTPRHRASRSHPREPERHGASRRHKAQPEPGHYVIGRPGYGFGFFGGVLGTTVSTNTNPPVSGPAPPDLQGPSGHLSPDQFVGFPGGFSTDAGNYTGVQAIEGAAGNGGAGGAADASSGATGGAPS